MTHLQPINLSYRISRRAVKQGARPVKPPQVTVEKIDTEKPNKSELPKLLKANKVLIFGTLNTQTLRQIWKISELISSAEKTNHDIICIQEHRIIHDENVIKEHDYGTWKLITCSDWRNSINASTCGIGFLVNKQAYSAITDIEKITHRIMTINLSGNPQTTIISCYSPTNVSDKQETLEFYTELNSLTRRISKHNVLIIGGDFNAQLGQTDGFKYSYHKTTNRNVTMLKNYLEENNLLCLNTTFQKRLGKIWTHNSLE